MKRSGGCRGVLRRAVVGRLTSARTRRRSFCADRTGGILDPPFPELLAAQIVLEGGAPGRTRTADAGLRTASLYPLSYGGALGSYLLGRCEACSDATRRGRRTGSTARLD